MPAPPVECKPIGVIRSGHCEAAKTPIQPAFALGCAGRAEVFPEFADGLDDVAGFSHVYLLYHFDRAGPAKLKVKPFLQDVERGIFAVRAPCRPNPLGLSVVEVVRRQGNVLHLNNVDILDGTPLLDIKPYIARFDRIDATRNGWQEQVDDATARKQGLRGYTPGDVPPDTLLADVIRFHGHLCPGLAIGYRAARAAMERLGARRAEDEEFIAIVENDSCAVDAVQYLTGCTFGKGNLFFRDYGKHVYTFAGRNGSRGVRIALRRREARVGEPPREEREARSQWILQAPLEMLFDLRDADVALPKPAVIQKTVLCAACGEEAMATRIVERGGRTFCRPCSEASNEDR